MSFTLRILFLPLLFPPLAPQLQPLFSRCPPHDASTLTNSATVVSSPISFALSPAHWMPPTVPSIPPVGLNTPPPSRHPTSHLSSLALPTASKSPHHLHLPILASNLALFAYNPRILPPLRASLRSNSTSPKQPRPLFSTSQLLSHSHHLSASSISFQCQLSLTSSYRHLLRSHPPLSPFHISLPPTLRHPRLSTSTSRPRHFSPTPLPSLPLYPLLAPTSSSSLCCLVALAQSSVRVVADPKSQSLHTPFAEQSTFSSFRSRWATGGL